MLGKNSHASDCQSDRVTLQMLGTGGPELITPSASTSYLIWLDNKARIVIDAGPGSAHNFKLSNARFADLSIFLFSHFHVDHSADFAAYIKGAFFTQRNIELQVYGPSGNLFVPSAEQFSQRLFSADNGLYPYLAEFIDPDKTSTYKIKTRTIEWSYKNLEVQTIFNDQDFVIKAAPVHHGPFPALAWRVEVAGCVISFSGDMSGRLGTLAELAEGSDLLIAHNAITEDVTGRAQLLHMKPSYIGKAAAQAKVKKLLLTHRMTHSRTHTIETLELIKKNYTGAITIPRDLDSFHP
ncbi:beta-lactamase-like protein [hydrothermal vent metagenome]|uniref:Beta-lactamase-like protein n=1 Tax=hydrothermal vent metagenome TaxID=652676 RepID=A0A3B1BEP5_9ZZZZ